MKKQILPTGFVVLSFLFPLKATAATFDKLYVFGDSLSDTGNVFTVSSAANKLDPSIPITPPSPPYFQGRFSNGPNWVDYLAPELGTAPVINSTALAVGGPIAFTPSGPTVNFNYGGATTTNSVNFSFGGARTGFESTDARLPVGLLTEVYSYTNDLNAAQKSADPDALYVVWAGPNDYNFGGLRSATVPIQNILTAVTALADKGARNILVPNIPDLGKTPRGLSTDPEGLTRVTQEHNSALTTVFNGLSDKYQGLNIIPFDVNAIFTDLRANPDKYGFTNLSSPCLTAVSVCANPNQYLFWDDIHPTTAGHRILAQGALESLNSAHTPTSVPEPASVLGILALGALGVGSKLKRKQQTARPVKGNLVGHESNV